KSREGRGKPGRAIGISADAPVRQIDTSGPTRRAIKEKAGRYGTMDRPYVIAIMNPDSFDVPGSIEDALFGTRSTQYDAGPRAAFAPRQVRLADGPWLSDKGPTNTRVSAVVTASNIAPSLVTRIAPRLWHNPWAARPMIDRLAWVTSRVVDGVLVDEPA